MFKVRRFSVVFAMASYMLASMAVHFLHDHSVAGHCCGIEAHHSDCEDGSCHSHTGHGSQPNNCEDSCFACRFHAVKSIAPVVVAVVEQIEVVQPLEWSPPVFVPVERSALPLSRGPPTV